MAKKRVFSFYLCFRGRAFILTKVPDLQKSSENLAEQKRHGTPAVRGRPKRSSKISDRCVIL